MSNSSNTNQNDNIASGKGGSSVWLLLIGLMLGLAAGTVVSGLLTGLGIIGDAQGSQMELAIGRLALVVVLIAVAIVLSILRLEQRNSRAGILIHRLDSIERSVRAMGEDAALSDDARRVLNRTRERDLLCAAIEEDIVNQHWDAAMVLVKELAERFGFRHDAEEFRDRIEHARSEIIAKRVAEAISKLDGLIIQKRWDVALSEAGRIQRLYPQSDRVKRLTERVVQARGRYKMDLERRFLHATEADNIDEAMGLLKELDAYLSNEDAEPFRELARGVIGQARENLGVRFKLAVQDRQWIEAGRLGERIIEEFPKTRMAEEVRDLLDEIRSRAASLVT